MKARLNLERACIPHEFMRNPRPFSLLPWAFFTLVLVACSGCDNASEKALEAARTPKEAAAHLDQAFANAPADAKQSAAAASEALKAGDFAKAIVSLEATKSSPSVTLDQGLAIHSSTLLLESQLISAIQAGDKNAERAYELLKAMKRK